jgi:hypothetical protein
MLTYADDEQTAKHTVPETVILVAPSVLAFSLSSHRHTDVCLALALSINNKLPLDRFIINNSEHTFAFSFHNKLNRTAHLTTDINDVEAQH